MRFGAVIAILLFIHLRLKCSAEDVEANCETICTCKEQAYKFSSKEYRIICKGDGIKSIKVTAKLFGDEQTPDWTRKSYVRIENFSRVQIKAGFMSRWLAYTSCSFDIWHSGKVTFPRDISSIGRTQAITFVFAGIGVLNSTIEEFPENMFKKKSSIGLKFVNSQIDFLNLYKLEAREVHYLEIKNSLIKVFEGDSAKSLNLVGSFSRGDAYVLVQHSNIAYLGQNALSFNDYKSRNKATVKIIDSSIGIVESSAIKIGKNISLKIETSSLYHVLPDAFSLVENSTFPSSIRANFIGVGPESLKNLKCNPSFQIQNNLLYMNDEAVECELDGEKYTSYLWCNNSLEVSNYLDLSCKHNHILGKSYPEPPLTEPSTSNTESITNFPTTIESNSITTRSISTTTTPCIYIVAPETNDTLSKNVSDENYYAPANKLLSGEAIPHGLFFVVIGLCAFLLTMVLFLTGIIIYNKMHKKEKKEVQCISCRDEAMLYETPSVFYNASTPNQCQLNLNIGTCQMGQRENKEKNENCYQEIPVKSVETKKKIVLVEEEATYMNMN